MAMMKKIINGTGTIFLLFLFAVIILYCIRQASGEQKTEYRVDIETLPLTESNKMLKNPNRGFYFINGFIIEDTEMDFRREFANRHYYDTETTLTLVEINLLRYLEREISEQGLANIENMFDSFCSLDKKMVLRFVYNWDGNNAKREPDSLEMILTHMRQLEPILRTYKEQIFVMQGLFVGDVGEMHNSKFLSEEDIHILLQQLEDVTDESTFLAVRTPLFWRRLTGIFKPEQVERESGALASRLSLFNDGMLGSETDYGTYGIGTLEENGPNAGWKREEELAFQDVLCRLVPNGGEVTVDNTYNDLQNAIRDMSVMHVTYLNRAHDGKVMEKWQNVRISEPGCFDNMDGLAYIERHLGYRLVIRDTGLKYHPEENTLSTDIIVQNVGFAPLYKEAEVRMVLCREDGSELYSCVIPQDLRELAGRTQEEETLTLHADISLDGLADGTWNVFFDTLDAESGQRIFYGNEQEPERFGYRIGSIQKAVAEGH